MSGSRILGFAKVRNEIIREGNVHRMLRNLAQFCNGGILCDDASTDGTGDVLEEFAHDHAGWQVMHVPQDEQSFDNELAVKDVMMRLIHDRHDEPDWIWWADADEWLADAKALRSYVEGHQSPGYRFHYTQPWRTTAWARTDDGFDDGVFVKLWRYTPDLSFDTGRGTHRNQFPKQIPYQACPVAPFEVVHYGNVGKNLVWKAIQYAGGLGGVDRHIHFGHSPSTSLATGVGFDKKYPAEVPVYRRVPDGLCPDAIGHLPPQPFTLDEIRRIRSMGNLRGLPGWFTVVVPTFNRAADLPRALDSLLYQRYTQWIALVLDDGSTDDTAAIMRQYQERDPRIFYARYPTNRGGVAVNELGMAMACEFTEYWSRLGSDDWWGPGKLERDAQALTFHDATFGPFTVWKHGRADHVCAGAWGNTTGTPSERLRRGEFLAGWANVAVRTSVLRKVCARFGNFCDPQLRNMEDFLVNARIAHVAEWVWHEGDSGDAFWNCLEGVGAAAGASASANAEVTARDNVITRRLIQEMGQEIGT